MIKKNDLVKVIYSRQLMDEGLLRLVNMKGKVLEVKQNSKTHPGAWVQFKDPITNQNVEWFIPLNSLRSRQSEYVAKNAKELLNMDL